MNVLIVAFHSRSMTPYAKKYEEILKEKNIDYDILFWDRFSDGPLDKKGNTYTFHCICTLGGNRLKKFVPFYRFRKAVKDIIVKNNYDKIIILNTMPAVLINDVITQKYKNNFIFDIRDYTYEKIYFYKKIVNKIIKYSYFTAISSDGYREFLSEEGSLSKLILNHNISNGECCVKWAKDIRNKKEIVLGYVGTIRYFKTNSKLIDIIKKGSNRIKLRYVGVFADSGKLKKFVDNNNYKDVEFIGEYNNREKPIIFKDIDIINAIYDNEEYNVTLSIPNKLYDCAIYKIPIIVSKNSFLSKIVEQYGLGLSIKLDNTLPKKLEDYISSFDCNQFNSNCDSFLKVVEYEEGLFKKRVSSFFK